MMKGGQVGLSQKFMNQDLGISMMIEMQSDSSTANCFIGSSTANEAH